MKQYNKANIPLAKQLRKNMTPWEQKLWYDYLRYYPIRFQRQKAIGEYIVDFYCAKARLVIELDGGGHYEPEQMTADLFRTQALERMNLKVLRICNLDVDKNFRGVCEHIDAAVQKSLPQSAPLTALPGPHPFCPLRGHFPRWRGNPPSSEGALVRRIRNKIFALGFFDGVHLGHQALLKECCALAEKKNAQPCAITFQQHPQSLFSENPPKLINTNDDRQRLLRQYGIEAVFSYPVTKAVMGMPWEIFLEELLHAGAIGFVCGNDFRFGNRGEGNAEKLKKFCQEQNLTYSIVEDQTMDDIRVSSTYIRSLLEEGEMEQAVRFLGHPHILTGEVVAGRKIGRTIGIPTANLAIPKDVVQLRHGVYACKATVEEKTFLAVTNVGSRPTVGGHVVTVEPWLLDFQGDLYGKTLTLEFYSFLRPERKFDSLEELKGEIQKNALQTRKFFEIS